MQIFAIVQDMAQSYYVIGHSETWFTKLNHVRISVIDFESENFEYHLNTLAVALCRTHLS